MNPVKMQKRAKFLAIIFRLAFILSVMSLIAITVMMFFTRQLHEKGVSINLPADPGGFVIFTRGFASGLNEITVFQRFLTGYLTALIYNLPITVVFWFANQYFTKLQLGGNPFSTEPIKLLKKINLWLYIFAIVPMFVAPVISNLILHEYKFVLAFTPALLIALIISLVIEVFQYGAYLQHEVDETV